MYVLVYETKKIYECSQTKYKKQHLLLRNIPHTCSDTLDELLSITNEASACIYTCDDFIKYCHSFSKRNESSDKNRYSIIYMKNPPRKKGYDSSHEIRWSRLTPEMLSESRRPLFDYFLKGGNREYIGQFKGRVKRICKAYSRDKIDVLIEPLKVRKIGKDNSNFEIVDHIWIKYLNAFDEMKLVEGEYISFKANVYAYLRENGTVDIGLKNIHYIKLITG